MKPGSAIARALASLARRVRSVASRGVVRQVDDEGGLQEIQLDLLDGETRELERFDEYGFASRPHEGAEAVALFLNGDRGHGVVLGVGDRRYRLRGLQAGEVALYDDLGSRVLLKRGGTLELKSLVRVVVDAPELHVAGDVVVDGNIDAAGQVADGTRAMAADRAIFNAHLHGGVETGSGSTAPPLPQQ